MNFGQAIEILKHGGAVQRAGWNGKGMFVYLVPANCYPARTGVAKAFFGEGALVPYNDYLALKGVDGTVNTWVPTISDVLAEDWRLAEGSAVVRVIDPTPIIPPAMAALAKLAEQALDDLAQAKFDVFADDGPSSTSRRAATVRALTGMMQLTQDPEALSVLTSMAMMNMEGEGLADVQAFFRKKLAGLPLTCDRRGAG